MKLNETQNLFKTDMLADLQPAGRLSVEQAFDYYHQGYVSRLTESLCESFPAVRWVVGDESFTKLCAQYIEAHPSTSYNLKTYGLTFPKFLSAQPKNKEYPFLEDLAHLEWLIKEIDQSPTPDPLPAERAQELLSADDFTVSFIEAMTVFQSHYSVRTLLKTSQDSTANFENTRWNTPESVLLFKKDQTAYAVSLDPIEAEILIELQEGRSISEALTDLNHLMSAKKLSELFHKLMKSGVIDDVSVWV